MTVFSSNMWCFIAHCEIVAVIPERCPIEPLDIFDPTSRPWYNGYSLFSLSVCVCVFVLCICT